MRCTVSAKFLYQLDDIQGLSRMTSVLILANKHRIILAKILTPIERLMLSVAGSKKIDI